MIVGLCVERSIEMVVGLLGILKAGGAYLPLDPEYPPERLAFMLEDAQASVLLTQSALRDRAGAHTVVFLDQEWARIAEHAQSAPITRVLPHNLAYVIYTSGSTGTPKGVAGIHRCVINRVIAQKGFAPMDSLSVGCQKGALGFVDSLFEMLCPLSRGARLVVIAAEEAGTPRKLLLAVEAQAVTHLVTVPSLAEALIQNQGVRRCASDSQDCETGHSVERDSGRIF